MRASSHEAVLDERRNGCLSLLQAEVIKEKVSSEEARDCNRISDEREGKGQFEAKQWFDPGQVIVRKQADEVKAIADDAQRDLDIAMPALESDSAGVGKGKTTSALQEHK